MEWGIRRTCWRFARPALQTQHSILNGLKNAGIITGLPKFSNHKLRQLVIMDPLSITASVFAIIQTSDRVAGVCKYYIDTVKNYPRELRVIFIETKSIAVVCEGLQFLRQDNVDDAAIRVGEEGKEVKAMFFRQRLAGIK